MLIVVVVSVSMRMIRLGMKVSYGVCRMLVCLVLSSVFYLDEGGVMLRLRNDSLEVYMIDCLIVMVNMVMSGWIVFGSICCLRMCY